MNDDEIEARAKRYREHLARMDYVFAHGHYFNPFVPDTCPDTCLAIRQKEAKR